MSREKRKHNRQAVLLTLMIIVLLFLIYNMFCFFLDLELPCIFDKKYFFGDWKHDYYIASFLSETSLNKQRMEIHKLLQSLTDELKAVQNKLKIIEEEHNKYIESEKKSKLLIEDFLYLLKDFSKGKSEIAGRYNDKIKNSIIGALNSKKEDFNSKFLELKAFLLAKKRYLENRIDYLTRYNESLNNEILRSNDRKSNRHTVKLPAVRLYADNKLESEKIKNPIDGSDNKFIKLDDISNVDKGYIVDIDNNKVMKLLSTLYNYNKEGEKILDLLTNHKITGKKIRIIFKNGEKLERKGDYKAALENYRNILIFNLSPFDRDVVLSKIEEINRKIVIDKIIRNDNRIASKLKVEADRYLKLDEKDKAREIYKRIIKEYSNSNYVDDAIEGLMKCQ